MIYATKYKHILHEYVSYLNFSAFAFNAGLSSYFICLRENVNTHCNCFLITSMKNSCLRLQIFVLFTVCFLLGTQNVATIHFEIIWVFREKVKREHEGKLISHLGLYTFNPISLAYTIYLQLYRQYLWSILPVLI